MNKQLIEKLRFLSRIDKYIASAHRRGNRQAVLSLQILRAVEQRNTNQLKDFVMAEKGTT